MEAKKLFRINLGLSLAMIAFIICEYAVLHFTSGGTAGLTGTAWFSNFVLLIAIVYGIRAYINGREMNKNLANAGLLMAFGSLLAFKFAVGGSVMRYDQMCGLWLSIVGGVILLIAFAMMVVEFAKQKSKSTKKQATKNGSAK